ncbi:MAG: hypothetical protein HY519_00460 [Candidatus Aenigmarchaeota archaeon]|nr:hypothetical protein [Candidatus Aenigmarchaeota archaeon]
MVGIAGGATAFTLINSSKNNEKGWVLENTTPKPSLSHHSTMIGSKLFNPPLSTAVLADLAIPRPVASHSYAPVHRTARNFPKSGLAARRSAGPLPGYNLNP